MSHCGTITVSNPLLFKIIAKQNAPAIPVRQLRKIDLPICTERSQVIDLVLHGRRPRTQIVFLVIQ